ncbi:ABC transporter [Niastella caeni]|uniref:ABC transporter n=1 Tax=Niastella caeni TaxID=2569763 RepID=A0A4S8HNF3_9BACT|nr:Gldg family protein [Niastella caeni]THU35989.1 ABC transporter [Niastella caeni]
MKTIFKIAQTELRTLFYSPIAWFLMIIFLIQCGITYMDMLEMIAREQDAGNKLNISLTDFIYFGKSGLVGGVMQYLYLYMPLLTMGLISRETSSGTIKLLHASPVKIRQIVLGKFLSMMIYSLLLLALIGVFVLLGMFQIQSPDAGKLLSALLGFFLLLCVYSAIGLFMSSLTNYQIVAAICTFVMFAILFYIGKLWQGVPFVRNLTYFLSVTGRTSNMLNGLITTKDVLYFILIVYLFLGLSVYKMQGDIESRPALVRMGRYVLVLVITLTIGYISSIPVLVGYYDATAGKARTLTKKAQQIIKELGREPLEVTAYNNLLGNYWYMGAPESYNTNLGKWEPYMRFKNNIELKTVLYYDSALDVRNPEKWFGGRTLEAVAKRNAESRDLSLADFKTPAEVRKLVDLRPEMNRYVMQLKYKGRTTFLRVFDDMHQWPSETEVSAALKRLQQASMPKIIFLTGHFERDINKAGDREYKVLTNLKNFRNSLINQGFDVDTLSLATHDIPAGISALVLADPKTAYTHAELAKLQQYIDNGGNMLIAGEPGKQALLSPLLNRLGVKMMDGVLVQPTKELAPELVTPYLTTTAAGFYPPLQHSHHDSAYISMPGVTALTYTDTGSFTIKPLLMTNGRSGWLKKDKLVSDSAEVLFDSTKGDERRSFATALGLTRTLNGKEQRIVITSDADFISNAELQRFNMRAANFVFNTGLFCWMSYGQFPIDSSRPPAKDTKVLLTKNQVKIAKIIFIWILPCILLAFGSILLIRRKRR